MKLLWLYDDLLDLYGDRGNMMAVFAKLQEAGYGPEIDRRSVGDEVDFSAYRFVYVGPGLISNTVMAAADIERHRAQIERAVGDGTVFLAVGSGQALFCRELITSGGDTCKGLGLFQTDLTEGNVITVADMICEHPEVPVKIYGFVNNTVSVGPHEEPSWLRVIGQGQDARLAEYAGLRKNNFFSTWLLGPILIRNPELLRFFMKKITGNDEIAYDDILERQAYETLMKEMGR